MKSMRVIGCGVTLLAILAASLVHAAEAKKAEKTHPSLVPVQDDPLLPRVLLIGDSISMGYTVPVREALAGKANVHHPPVNCGPTSRGVEELDAWLGDGRWDVIHFNFGLHDLKRMTNGNRRVPPEQYEKHLREIVARLKKTGATLVWCTTTPVPKKSSPQRSNEDVQAYNAVAKKITEENGIRISDLYEFALPKIQDIQIPDNVHFTPEGSKVLAEQVSRAIQEALASGKK